MSSLVRRRASYQEGHQPFCEDGLVWEEEVDEKLSPSEKDKEREGIKVLAELLVKWGKALDSISGEAGNWRRGY